MLLVPLCKYDLEFLSGEISDDAFLASLFYRDDAIEADQYVARFPTRTELEKYENLIKKLGYTELADRLLKHAHLTTEFRHFHILRFEPYAEKLSLDPKDVPFLLSKTANLKRYYAGESSYFFLY